MKKDTIIKLTNTFEEQLHFTENGVEFWFARDLQHLLGYEKWDNFQNVINKAKVACKISGYEDSDHFADVGKMVSIGSRAQKEIEDLMLTRFACYLIAQNGDPRKEQIAFAQTYFALQTRKLEIIVILYHIFAFAQNTCCAEPIVSNHTSIIQTAVKYVHRNSSV